MAEARADLEAYELAKYGHPCGICGYAICECPIFRVHDENHLRHPKQVRPRLLAAYYVATVCDDLVGYI